MLEMQKNLKGLSKDDNKANYKFNKNYKKQKTKRGDDQKVEGKSTKLIPQHSPDQQPACSNRQVHVLSMTRRVRVEAGLSEHSWVVILQLPRQSDSLLKII